MVAETFFKAGSSAAGAVRGGVQTGTETGARALMQGQAHTGTQRLLHRRAY